MKIVFTIRFILPLFTAGILFFFSNHFLKSYQKKQYDKTASRVLSYSEDVSTHLSGGLNDAIRAGISTCATENIYTLRQIRQQYKYIDDIGIIRGNKIICTANWGELSEELSLPHEYHSTPNGFLIYHFPENNNYIKSHRSATTLNNIIVFNSAFYFADALNPRPEYRIVLTSHNRKTIYYTWGVLQPRHNHVLSSFFSINTHVCSTRRDFCVIINNENAGLMVLPGLVFFIILVGLLPGVLLSSTIVNIIKSRKSLKYRFIHALRNNELFMVYQPVFRVGDNNIISFESLIRWKDRYFGSVSPELFIQLAERLGWYNVLSAFVMKTSLDEMSNYLMLYPEIQLSLNVGDDDINDIQYLSRLKKECQTRSLSHRQIKLEITERCMSDYNSLSTFCNLARRYGFSVSLDDFGTGNCNISWLTELDFDEVKIDKFLVQNIVEVNKREMLLSIIDGLKNTGKRLVFEGVETQAQFDALCLLNPDFLVQGWYTGKPIPVQEVEKIIEFNRKY